MNLKLCIQVTQEEKFEVEERLMGLYGQREITAQLS